MGKDDEYKKNNDILELCKDLKSNTWNESCSNPIWLNSNRLTQLSK